MKHGEKLEKRFRQVFEIDELVDERDGFEMRGASEVTVREVGGFLYYSEGEIRLSLKKYILKIVGIGLYCSSYLGGIVRVCGDIKSLEIERREKRH